MSRDLDPDDVASDDTLQTFHAEICALQDKYNDTRTAKIFLNIPQCSYLIQANIVWISPQQVKYVPVDPVSFIMGSDECQKQLKG